MTATRKGLLNMTSAQRISTCRSGDLALAPHIAALGVQADEMLPRVLKRWKLNNKFLPLLYDEIASLLARLDDQGFARVRREACGPLEISDATNNFLQANALLLQIDSLFMPENDPQGTLGDCAWGFHLLRYHSAVGFCREKLLPTANGIVRAAKVSGACAKIARDLVKDMEDMQAVFDFRNALAHWNCSFDRFNTTVVFYTRIDPPPDRQGLEVKYRERKWTLDQASFLTTFTMWATMTVLLALCDEEDRRSGSRSEV